MKKTLLIIFLLLAITSSGCSKGQFGTGAGAAAGALIGQAIGHSTEATLIGAAVGSLFGYIVGNEMDKFDAQMLNRAYETTPTNQSSKWRNPDTGNMYSVTPKKTYNNNQGPCRIAEIRATINGKTEILTETACRDNRGLWILQ